MRISAVALLIAVLPLTTACADRDGEGSWVLVRVDGEQLPVVDGGVALTSASVEIQGDSLIETQTVVFGWRTHTPDEIEIRNAVAYEVDGSIIRALPEAFTIPDDTFEQCSGGGVYRLEDAGRTLRLIDWVMVGECRVPADPYVPTRLYQRR